MTILVVDDEPSIRDIIKRYMEENGHTVFIAPSGKDALTPEQINHEDVDVILLDLNLPDENSYRLSVELKACCPQAFLIYMSADPDLYHKAEEEILPDAEFLEKPFTLIDLETLLNDTITK